MYILKIHFILSDVVPLVELYSLEGLVISARARLLLAELRLL